MEFSSFLQETLGKHNPEEIEELILDDLFSQYETLPVMNIDHKKGLEQYQSLIHLSLNNLGLEKLENFPSLPNLQILQVKDNKLTGEDLNILCDLYPNLYKIKLSNNKIASFEVFKVFEKTGISKIEVKGNPIVEENLQTYRDIIYKMLPRVYIIDDIDKKGNEVETSIYNESDEQDEEYEEEEDENINDDEEEFEDEELEEDEEESYEDESDSEDKRKNRKKPKRH